MHQAYLEVTFRHGSPLAAYYYLPRRPGDRVHRSHRSDAGLVVDYAEDGTPIGIEITAPHTVTLAELNALLEQLGLEPVAERDLAPLHAA